MKPGEIVVDKHDLDLAERVSNQHPSYHDQVFTAVLAAVLVGRLAGKETLTPTAPKRALKPVAATEFFAKVKPSQDVEKALAAAYFLETYRNAEDFTPEAIRDCLREGKISPPANISLAVLNNARKGLMAPTSKKQGGKKAWILTQTGSDAVEKLLQPATEDKEQTIG